MILILYCIVSALHALAALYGGDSSQVFDFSDIRQVYVKEGHTIQRELFSTTELHS
eukprot:SAG11_NODE_27243_length_335_cov_0.644068_1_plen_55_part_10